MMRIKLSGKAAATAGKSSQGLVLKYPSDFVAAGAGLRSRIWRVFVVTMSPRIYAESTAPTVVD